MARCRFFRLVTAIIFLAVIAAADDDEYQCHDLYEYDASVKGTVSSPFYGKRPEYHSGLWCEYRIRAPDGYTIKITFLDLDIDPSTACGQDQLFVFGKDKATVLGNFCGSEIPEPLLSNKGESEIRLLFRTDYMAGRRGFNLQYESAPHLELCATGYTQCGNRRCFKNEKKCDGTDDCGDGTDEEDCRMPIVAQPAECGIQAIKPHTIHESPDRIVGGDVVVPNSWPWQVSLQTRNSEPNGHFCGGTIINAQWILTATHCVVAFPNPGEIKVVVGAHGKFTKTPYEKIRYSQRVIGYPDLEGEKMQHFAMNNDISLIKLNAPIAFNKGVQPACLPQLGWQLQPGWTCYVTGWGETRGSGGSDALKQSEQIIQPKQNCSFNEKTQICVEKKNKSPCHGDSGGPLQCQLSGSWFVFGAASFVTTSNYFGGICTGPGAMTVYANAADKADWIQTIINKYT